MHKINICAQLYNTLVDFKDINDMTILYDKAKSVMTFTTIMKSRRDNFA